MTHARATDVRKWLLLILAAKPVTMSVDEADAKVRLMTPSMTARYPAEAFSDLSLQAVSGATKFFNEADIRASLDLWWQENNPDKSGLPVEVADAPLDDVGRQWAAHFYRAENDAAATAALGLIKSKHTGAFAWLVRTEVRAAAIAVRHQWEDPGCYSSGQREAEWGDPAVVYWAVRLATEPTIDVRSLSMLRIVLMRFAPHNLPLIETNVLLFGE